MTKKGGWFRQSERHSLASKGIKTAEMKQKARTPRAPSKAKVSSSGMPPTKGGETLMLSESDEQFGQLFRDENGEELRLLGVVLNEADKPTKLIFLGEDDKRVERDPREVQPIGEN